MSFTKENMVKSLKESICEVVFTKTDGTERTMVCSLKSDIVNPFIKEIEERNKKLLQEGKEIKQKPENPNVISVIDTEANGWRSFKVDTVKSFNVID